MGAAEDRFVDRVQFTVFDLYERVIRPGAKSYKSGQDHGTVQELRSVCRRYGGFLYAPLLPVLGLTGLPCLCGVVVSSGAAAGDFPVSQMRRRACSIWDGVTEELAIALRIRLMNVAARLRTVGPTTFLDFAGRENLRSQVDRIALRHGRSLDKRLNCEPVLRPSGPLECFEINTHFKQEFIRCGWPSPMPYRPCTVPRW